MNFSPIFLASVRQGKLVFNNPAGFNNYLLKLNDKSVDVVVRFPRKDRSDKQNRWYWKCVVGIPAEHFGYLPEEMHEAYKFIFLRLHEEGKPETVRSTATLSTIEFKLYTEKCQQWAAEQGIYIPDPKQVEV